MKLVKILEEVSCSVYEIDKDDIKSLDEFCNFYNESGQLSWVLTPQRLLGKIGHSGSIYGMYCQGVLKGTIGLKTTDIPQTKELGYIMLDEDIRSLRAVMSLYRAVSSDIKKTKSVFATTNTNNQNINKLMEFSNKFVKIGMMKSQFSSNKLYLWLAIESSGDFESNKEILFKEYENSMIEEY